MRRSFLEYLILTLDNFSQKKNFDFLKSIYGSKLEIVFDIGCHKGETVDLLKKNFKIKKIYAFDVNTRIIEKLKEEEYLNVSFLNYGISSVSEKKEFNFSKFSPINSLKSNDKFSSYSKFKELVIKILNHPSTSFKSKKSIINLITLDDFCEKKKIKIINLRFDQRTLNKRPTKLLMYKVCEGRISDIVMNKVCGSNLFNKN